MAIRMLVQEQSALRRVVQADGIFEAALGATLLLGAAPLAERAGVPTLVMAGMGGGLLLYAAWLLRVAASQPLSMPMARLAAWLNLSWVGLCLLMLLAGWLPPTSFGRWGLFFTADAAATFGLLQLYLARKVTV
jgi:hypothetical protein